MEREECGGEKKEERGGNHLGASDRKSLAGCDLRTMRTPIKADVKGMIHSDMFGCTPIPAVV